MGESAIAVEAYNAVRKSDFEVHDDDGINPISLLVQNQKAEVTAKHDRHGGRKASIWLKDANAQRFQAKENARLIAQSLVRYNEMSEDHSALAAFSREKLETEEDVAD